MNWAEIRISDPHALTMVHCNGTKAGNKTNNYSYNLFGEIEPNWHCVGLGWLVCYISSIFVSIVIFSFLAVASFLSLILIIRQAGVNAKMISVVALVLMVFICAVSRVIALILEVVLHPKYSFWLHLIYDVGTPGLGAAFMNLVVIIFETTKCRIERPFFLNYKFVFLLYIFHVVIGTSKDAIGALFLNHPYFIQNSELVYHAMHAIFQYTTGLASLVANKNLKQNLRASRFHQNDPMASRLKVLQKLTVGCAMLAFVIATLSIYEAFRGEIRPLSKLDTSKNPWEYLLMNLLTHLAESCGCAMVLVAFMNTNRAHHLRATFGRAARRYSRSSFDSRYRHEVIKNGCLCCKWTADKQIEEHTFHLTVAEKELNQEQKMVENEETPVDPTQD